MAAKRNEITERLVDCSDKDQCAVQETLPSGVTIAVFPKSCPVFRGSRA